LPKIIIDLRRIGKSVCRIDCFLGVVRGKSHFYKHAHVDAREYQSAERQQNCGIRGAALMITTPPPISWRNKQSPEPKGLLERLTVIESVGASRLHAQP